MCTSFPLLSCSCDIILHSRPFMSCSFYINWHSIIIVIINLFITVVQELYDHCSRRLAAGHLTRTQPLAYHASSSGLIPLFSSDADFDREWAQGDCLVPDELFGAYSRSETPADRARSMETVATHLRRARQQSRPWHSSPSLL